MSEVADATPSLEVFMALGRRFSTLAALLLVSAASTNIAIAEEHTQLVLNDELATSPSAPEYVSSDPKAHLYPPSVVPKVRINPEAPGPFKGMVMASQDGDRELATQYADTFVQYMVNVMFEVREYTQLIGEALVRNGVVEEEDWVGVGQFMNVQAARARQQDSSVLAATHEMALKRVKKDPKGEASIYIFCAIGNHYCREMGPDIERVWRLTQADPRLKMTILSIDNRSPEYIKAFKEYTGITAPIGDGTEVAKAFRIKFVPAVVVVAPTIKKAYLRTGQQEFTRLYEFIRTVQGEPVKQTPLAQRLALTPIGEVETAKKMGRPLLWEAKAPTNADSLIKVGLTERSAPQVAAVTKF